MRRMKLAVGALIVLAAAAALAVLGDLVERGSAQITGGGGPGMPYNQGPVTPGTCAAPMMFYNNTAPGTYSGCYSNGTFGPFGAGGGGGATMLAQLGDLAVINTPGNSAQLTVCANCSTTTRATVGFRWYSQQITGPATINITTGTLSDFAYIYYVNGTGIVVGSPTMNANLSCTGCTIAGGAVSAFPTNSVPIAQVQATSGAWNAITPTMDARAFLRTANVAGTAGVNCSDSNGDLQCSADQATVLYRVAVPGSLTAACTPGNYAMDTVYLYVCQASGNWLHAPWLPATTRAGDISYWNGTNYTLLPGNNSGTNCLQESAAGVPTWAACGTGGGGVPGPTLWVNKNVSYTMTAADFSAYTGFYVTASTPTFTLAPNTPQPPAGQCVVIANMTAGAGVTIARNGQLLNTQSGVMSLAGGAPQTPSWTSVCSDGTNYFTPGYFFGFRGAQGTILTTQGGGVLATSGVSVNNVPIYGDGTIGVRNGEALVGGTGVAGNLACVTAANSQGSCTVAGAANFIGVFTSTTNYVTEGQVTVNLDASSTVTFGDFICVSGTVAGAMHDNSTTPCTAGLQIGIAATNGTATTTILTSLRR